MDRFHAELHGQTVEFFLTDQVFEGDCGPFAEGIGQGISRRVYIRGVIRGGCFIPGVACGRSALGPDK